MSTRVVRSINDFARHRLDVQVWCYCGHQAILPYRLVVSRFIDAGWPRSLDSATAHFRCSKCGSRPKWIGPLPR